MGHSWAQNIPDHIGGAALGTLAARVLGNPNVWITNHEQDPGNVRYYFVPLPGMGDEIFRGVFFYPAWQPRFPYNVPVIPDVHL